VFSPLQFATALDANFLPVNPALVFQNPVGHLYAQFTYDKMTPGAQWSALWYYGNELVYYETNPWDGGTGGIGYSDWNPEPSLWLQGEYEVQIFVGQSWKTSGRFTVEGQPPTAVPSLTSTPTRKPTNTITPTLTRRPTATITQTFTRRPTATNMPTQTPFPRPTYKSPTPTIEKTHTPTRTPLPPTPSATHAPTLTPYRTPTP
jgi:hypothetical protein